MHFLFAACKIGVTKSAKQQAFETLFAMFAELQKPFNRKGPQMKKYLFIALTMLCLTACQTEQKPETLSLDQKSALRTCLMNESLAAVQNGTAFTADLSELAQSIAKSCVKKQALQNLGLDDESAAWAQNILSSVATNK